MWLLRPIFVLTDQVVSDHVQAKHSGGVLFAAYLELAKAAEFLLLWKRLGLDPAKHLLDAPAGIDPFGLALKADGAAIHPYAPTAFVVLVAPNELLSSVRAISSHLLGRILLTKPIGQRHPTIDHPIVAVLDEPMPPVAKLRRKSNGFAGQQGLRIRRGAVAVVSRLPLPR